MSLRFTSLALLLTLGCIWGTGYSIARFAMTHGVPALGYSFWQAIGPAILISLFMRVNRTTTHSSITYSFKQHLRYYFICGLTGIAIPNTIMYLAAPHIPAGLLAVIVNTVPVFVYAMSLTNGLETFCWTRMIGVASAFCGLMLIVFPHTSDMAMSSWVLISLLTPLSFAFCAVYISKYRPASSDSFSLARGTLIAASLLILPIVILSGNFYWLHVPLTMPDAVILLEIVLSSIGYILLFRIIKLAGPVFYSLVDSIVALTGLFWGYVLFDERLNNASACAILLILIALFMVTKRQEAVVEYSTT